MKICVSRFGSLSALHNDHRRNLCKKTTYVSVVSVIIITPWLGLHQMSWMKPFCFISFKTCSPYIFHDFPSAWGGVDSADWTFFMRWTYRILNEAYVVLSFHEFHFFLFFPRSGKQAVAIVGITHPWFQCTAWQHLEHGVNSPHNTGWIHCFFHQQKPLFHVMMPVVHDQTLGGMCRFNVWLWTEAEGLWIKTNRPG